MDRRTTLKWMLAASATLPLAARPDCATADTPDPFGYGTDPDLLKTRHPGELWPLQFTPAQRRTAATLCDVIIPADAVSPAASAVGVVDFLDEWISAPYPQQRADRHLVLEGLVWFDSESERRFMKDFAALTGDQQRAICDDVCLEATAGPTFSRAAACFRRFRELTAGGFYSTPVGRQDIGYVGNIPRPTFDGPPLELLRKLGLAPS